MNFDLIFLNYSVKLLAISSVLQYVIANFTKRLGNLISRAIAIGRVNATKSYV